MHKVQTPVFEDLLKYYGVAYMHLFRRSRFLDFVYNLMFLETHNI
jgi:hypothetical protein